MLRWAAEVLLFVLSVCVTTLAKPGALTALVVPTGDYTDDYDITEEGILTALASSAAAAAAAANPLSIQDTSLNSLGNHQENPSLALMDSVLRVLQPKKKSTYTGPPGLSTSPAGSRLPFEDRHCRMVCDPCSKHLPTRWAALCYRHCQRGGKAFDACVTVVAVLEGAREE